MIEYIGTNRPNNHNYFGSIAQLILPTIFMSRLESKVNLEYNGKKYTVVIITHLGNEMPILLDRPIYKIIKKLGYSWYLNDKNHVYTVKTSTYRGIKRDDYIYIHDMVMRLGRAGVSQKEVPSSKTVEYLRFALSPSKNEYPIIHQNRVHFDNRYSNLKYDTPNKTTYVKNTKKKKRTINLKKHGIEVRELPTYVWYLKPDKSHGGRFCIEIPGEISWRSTSSKKLTLRYKLEETKKYLRHLRRKRADIFNYFSMNGDLNLEGKTLLNEYNKMIRHAGFEIPISEVSNTERFIQKDTSDLTPEEVYILYRFDPIEGSVNVSRAVKEYQRQFDALFKT